MAEFVRVLVLVVRESSDAESSQWVMVAVSDLVDDTDHVRVVGVDGSPFVEPFGFVQEHDTGIPQAQQWAESLLGSFDAPVVHEAVVTMPEPLLRGDPLSKWFDNVFYQAGVRLDCPRLRRNIEW